MAAGRPKLAAASVIEGVNYGYWQFLLSIDSGSDSPGSFTDQSKKTVDAAPFGAGLQTWFQHSPIFNLDKATPPLLMLETGPENVLGDWEPYAALYYQHRPVDLVLLQAGEHVQSNPQQRLATQGMTVDWYRFWLQGYEDPDSAKAEQYVRWHKLRDMHTRTKLRVAALISRSAALRISATSARVGVRGGVSRAGATGSVDRGETARSLAPPNSGLPEIGITDLQRSPLAENWPLVRGTWL